MSTATISPKYQVVIPKDIREQTGVKSGQKVIFIAKRGIIYMVPEVPLEKLEGILKGMDISNYREHKDRY